MFRQRANLISVYCDLSDRYGHDDPIMVQLKDGVDRRQSQTGVLPFGERRKLTQQSHLRTQSLHRRGGLRGDAPAP